MLSLDLVRWPQKKSSAIGPCHLGYARMPGGATAHNAREKGRRLEQPTPAANMGYPSTSPGKCRGPAGHNKGAPETSETGPPNDSIPAGIRRLPRIQSPASRRGPGCRVHNLLSLNMA